MELLLLTRPPRCINEHGKSRESMVAPSPAWRSRRFSLGKRKISLTEFPTTGLGTGLGEGPSHAWLLVRLLASNTKMSGTWSTGMDMWGHELCGVFSKTFLHK